MTQTTQDKATALTCWMIGSDSRLADGFLRIVGSRPEVRISRGLRGCPGEEVIDLFSEEEPELVFLDASAEPAKGEALVERIGARLPGLPVVALLAKRDSAAVLRLLRAGASDVLAPPFHDGSVEACLERFVRRRESEAPPLAPALGRVVAFSSLKPGSGATVLALQTAFALRKNGARRVLFVDLDLAAGTSAGWNGDARKRAVPKFEGTSSLNSVDILASPRQPWTEALTAVEMDEMITRAREDYDWVVLDLPGVPHPTAIAGLILSDERCVVSTAELGSLHLAHRHLAMLEQFGLERKSLRILVNRTGHGEPLGAAQLEKIFKTPAEMCLPDEPSALPLAGASPLPAEERSPLAAALTHLAIRLAREDRAG